MCTVLESATQQAQAMLMVYADRVLFQRMSESSLVCAQDALQKMTMYLLQNLGKTVQRFDRT